MNKKTKECISLEWRLHIQKMDTTGMINFYNMTIYVFKYEKINMNDRITI